MRRARSIPGKDEYCSPEQASYAVTDARADLFSLGIVLTELLLGRNIFRADDRLQSRKNVLSMPIPRFSDLRPDIDEKLETILHKALERDRDRRYQSAVRAADRPGALPLQRPLRPHQREARRLPARAVRPARARRRAAHLRASPGGLTATPSCAAPDP